MKFSDIKGRQVVALGSADKVGYIANAFVSADGGSVTGFEVAMRGLLAGHRVFTWDSLSSIGADAVTIANVEALHEADKSTLADAASTDTIIGAKVMEERGEDAGTVGDIDFDAASGVISAYILSPSLVERIERHQETFAPSSIKSMSDKLIVVSDGAVQQVS
jgi:uncharacterized protein YrrD